MADEIEIGTRDLDDLDYVECLETIIFTLQSSVNCKKEEME